MTDPRGYNNTTTFNNDGYVYQETKAVGKPEQQITTHNRQSGTGLLLSATDACNRTTSFTYDAMGNVVSTTKAFGTTCGATQSTTVTTTLAYDPRYYELSSITDPLNNTTTLAYDNSGNMLSVTRSPRRHHHLHL